MIKIDVGRKIHAGVLPACCARVPGTAARDAISGVGIRRRSPSRDFLYDKQWVNEYYLNICFH
jgi:hypothetical protein